MKAANGFLMLASLQTLIMIVLISIMVSLKKWHEFKREYDLHENSYFQFVQLIDYSRKMELYH